MLTIKGKYDGKNIRLDHDVPVTREVSVLVSFPEWPVGQDNSEFLLNGPTLSQEELDDIDSFIQEFRRWKV